MPRPRRSAAAKAQGAISDHARWADDNPSNRTAQARMSSRRNNRVVRDDADSDDDSSPHRNVTVKVPSSKLRQATTRGGSSKSRGVSEAFEGGQVVSGKRDRGGKKKYVVDSSDDDDDDDEEEEVPQLDDDDEEDEEMDEDAEGEDDMDLDADGEDVDAEGEEDAEGDVDMDLQPAPATSTIKLSRKGNSKPTARAAAQRVVPDDDDDDDELSDPVDSDAGDQTMGMEEEDEEEDAEGEEDVELDAEGEDAGDLDSLEEGSEQEEPDLSKMSRRQRARFEEGPQDFMELSNEVQAKKVFTQEEQNMRRQEMARRRRNLSEKRNEEVKMETINKLLKKQAPKVNKKAAAAAAAAEATPQDDSSKINPAFIRWTSTKDGCRVGVPTEMFEGPAGKLFAKKGLVGGTMVEEVA